MSQEQPVDPTRIVPEGFVFPGTEVLDPREVFAGPGYQAPQQRTDPVAVIALVMTVFTLFPGFGALAALTGWWALRRLRRGWESSPARRRPRGGCGCGGRPPERGRGVRGDDGRPADDDRPPPPPGSERGIREMFLRHDHRTP